MTPTPCSRPWSALRALEPRYGTRVVDNAAEHRYELWVGDERAGVIEYGIRPGVVELIHTEIVPPSRGAGSGRGSSPAHWMTSALAGSSSSQPARSSARIFDGTRNSAT